MTDQTTPTPFSLPPDFPDRTAFEAEWVAALRRGEYEQAQGQLRSGQRRCCLGVACDVAIRHGVGQWDGNVYEGFDGERSESVLPVWLARFLGRDDLGASGPEGSPVTLNDNGVPFATIASVIEGTVAYAAAEKAWGRT